MRCLKKEVETCKVGFSNTWFDWKDTIQISDYVVGMYFWEGLNKGCGECTDPTNYVITQYIPTNNTDLGQNFCMNKDVIDSSLTDHQPVNIPDCQNYFYVSGETTYKCFQCKPGFILTNDKNCTAVDPDRLPDCKIANIQGGSVCMECNDDTSVNVGGLCTPILLFPECIEFNNEASFTE